MPAASAAVPAMGQLVHALPQARWTSILQGRPSSLVCCMVRSACACTDDLVHCYFPAAQWGCVPTEQPVNGSRVRMEHCWQHLAGCIEVVMYPSAHSRSSHPCLCKCGACSDCRLGLSYLNCVHWALVVRSQRLKLPLSVNEKK